MADFKPLIDALYTNFLLRDLFAKMVPGAIVLGAAFYGSGGNDHAELLVSLQELAGWTLVLFVIGTAWLTGFAVQTIGEVTPLIRHHPDRYSDADYRYTRRREFADAASEDDKRQHERYWIIKEATGNAGTSVVVALAALALRPDWGSEPPTVLLGHAPQLMLLAIIAIALIRTNRSHMRKQYQFIDLVLDSKTSVDEAAPEPRS